MEYLEFSDDKNALKEICKNLNCQSPKINLIDPQKCKKRNMPKIVNSDIVHLKMLRQQDVSETGLCLFNPKNCIMIHIIALEI